MALKSIINRYRTPRNVFIRQQGAFDCGTTCLAMVFKYAGNCHYKKIFDEPASGPLSLLELRRLAGIAGLKSNCVRMEQHTLMQLTTPAILHLSGAEGTPHFELFLPVRRLFGKGEVLLADPARGFHFCKLHELDNRWTSRAALFFPDLKRGKSTGAPFSYLRGAMTLCNGLPWLAIPILQVFAALIGIGLIAGLEAATAGLASLDLRQTLVFTLLLAVLLLAKEAFTYLSRTIYLKSSRKITERLVSAYLLREGPAPDAQRFSLLQKITHGVEVLLTQLLPNALLIGLLLAFQIYLMPVTAVITGCALTTLMLISYTCNRSNQYMLGDLDQKRFALEKKILPYLSYDKGNQINRAQLWQDMNGLMNAADVVAFHNARQMLATNLCGGTFFLLVTTYVIFAGTNQPQLVLNGVASLIGCYFIVTLALRLTQVVPAVAIASDAFRHMEETAADRGS